MPIVYVPLITGVVPLGQSNQTIGTCCPKNLKFPLNTIFAVVVSLAIKTKFFNEPNGVSSSANILSIDKLMGLEYFNN